MASAELLQLGITEALTRIRSRQLSPVELTRVYLERISQPESAPECLPHGYGRRSAGNGGGGRTASDRAVRHSARFTASQWH